MASVRIGGARVDITGQSAGLEKAMRRASMAYDRQGKDLKRLRGQAKKTNTAYDGLAKAAKRVGPLAAGALGGFGLAQAVKSIAAFEQGIADLSAITGATGKDLEALEAASLKLGATTTYAGTEVAEAFKLVASAKPDLLSSTAALTEVTKATLTLAEAAGIDLAAAADGLGLTLNQFGLGADQAGRVINVLAAGSKFGAASIASIGLAMKEFGVSASTAGVSVETATAAVEALAAVGIKGSQAGTALRNIILKLETQSESLRPSVVGLTSAFDNLNARNLDTKELTKLVGLENVNAAQALLGNVDAVRKLEEQLTGTNVAYEQAAIRTQTLEGRTKTLAGAWESFLNRLSNTAPLKAATDGLTALLNAASGAAPADAPSIAEQRVKKLIALKKEELFLAKATAAFDANPLSERLQQVYEKSLATVRKLKNEVLELRGLSGPPAPARVEADTYGAAVTPDRGEHYTDPYGPLGLEAAFADTPGRNAQRGKELLEALTAARKRDAQAAKESADAEKAWASEVEAARKRLLGGNVFGGGRGGDPRALANQARLQAWEEERVAHEEAVAARVKVEKAASDEVMRQANAVRDAQVKAARDAQRAWETMAMSIGDHFANAFGAFVGGSQSAGEAFRSFASGVIAEMLRIQAQAAAAELLSFLGGLFVAGAPSGWRPTGGSTIRGGIPTYGLPGARQLGGPVSAGRAYTVNEATGRSEVFVPDRDGRIVPPHKAGGMGGGVHIDRFTVEGVNDPTAILAVLYREIPRITSAVEGNIMDKSRYNNALRSALQRAAGTR